MIELNAQQAFILPPAKKQGEEIEITRDELTALIASIQENLSEETRKELDLSTQFEIHIGKNSKYTHKNVICMRMKVIYDKFMQPNISSSEKESIAYKLIERATHCTPGFHDGVNTLVDSFYLACDMDELLYRVRHDIVSRTANQLTDEIHTYTRFFTLASEKYVVHAINSEDSYVGELTDETIQRHLAAAFGNEYRIFSILQGLEEQLCGQLTNAGYEGAKESGYIESEKLSASFDLLFSHDPVVIALSEAKKIKDALPNATAIREASLKAMEQVIVSSEESEPRPSRSGTPLANARGSDSSDETNSSDKFLKLEQHTKAKLNCLLDDVGLPKIQNWKKEVLDNLTEHEKQQIQLIRSNYKEQSNPVFIANKNLAVATQTYNGRFFIQGENGITDINWANIKQMIWAVVKKQHYFIFTADEDKTIDSLMSQTISANEIDVHFIDVCNKLRSGNELAQVLNYFQQPSEQIKKGMVDEYFDDVEETISYENFATFICTVNDIEIKREVFEKLYPRFIEKLSQDHFVLMRIIRIMNSNDLIALFNVNHFDVKGLLTQVISHYPSAIPSMVVGLQGMNNTFSKEDLNKIMLLALGSGSLDLVNVLISKGANVNAVDSDGYSVLMLAAHKGLVDVVVALIDKGADVNYVDPTGITALQCAVLNGLVDVVMALIDKGADVNYVGPTGLTPLRYALFYRHADMVKVLIDKGADVNYVGPTGKTPLSYALFNGHADMVKVLIDNNACILGERGYNFGDLLYPKAIPENIKAILNNTDFNTHFNILYQKWQTLENKASLNPNTYQAGAKAAKKLMTKLAKAKYDLLHPDPDIAHDFIAECIEAITEAEPELKKHRGFKQAIVDFMTAILTLGLSKLLFSESIFPVQTDSMKKLGLFKQALQLGRSAGRSEPRPLGSEAFCEPSKFSAS